MISLDRVSTIGVLDVNHGALALAQRLTDAGFEAFAVDVYGTRRPADPCVPVLAIDEVTGYDALVAPVHLPENRLTREARLTGRPVCSHHEAVGYLVERSGLTKKMKTVEVTGTVGKTTSCFTLARILAAAGEKVLLHTSNGLFYDGALVVKGLSITPASVLAVLDQAQKLRPDVCIFEVSLGVCGFGDVIALTSLERDYPIADGTSLASVAKLNSLRKAGGGKKLVCPAGTIASDITPACTFGAGGNISYNAAGDVSYGADGNETISLDLPVTLDRDVYERPILCAAAIAHVLGVRPDTTALALRGFDGVEGRMKLSSLEGRILVDNSNSGLACEDVAAAIRYARRCNGRRVLVAGEESYNVCSGLDPGRSQGIIADSGLDDVVLVGRRMKEYAGPRRWAESLSEGLRTALSLTAPGDTIVSCVKTWR